MKLSKIKKAIQGNKTWILVNREDGGQWIGDGAAVYAVPENIDMTAVNAPTILDIAPDKAAEYFIRVIDEPPTWFDNLPREGEEDVLIPQATVVYADHQIEIMTTREGVCVMLDAGYLAPAMDAEEGVGYTLRHRVNAKTGEPMEPIVAVYDDMTVCALVTPMHKNVAEGVWQELRKACAPGLTYAMGGGGKDA